jgi:hypothetical protein
MNDLNLNSTCKGGIVLRRIRIHAVTAALAGTAAFVALTLTACGASRGSASSATNVTPSLSLAASSNIINEARTFDSFVTQNCPGSTAGSACFDHVKDLAIEFRTFRSNIKPHDADPALRQAVALADQGSQYFGRDYSDVAVQREVMSLADQLDSWLVTHVPGTRGQSPSVPSPHPTT